MRDRLVIAIGNTLRGDDGIAARVVAAVGNEIAASDVIVVQQLTIELAPVVAEASHVLFLDASVLLPPGDSELNPLPFDVEADSPFGHHLEPAALLFLARELFNATTSAALLSIGAADFDTPDKLSPQLSAQLPRYAAEVLDWYRAAEYADFETHV